MRLLGLWAVWIDHIDGRTKDQSNLHPQGNGGKVWQITGLLLRDYLMIVLIAGVFTPPIGYYLMQH